MTCFPAGAGRAHRVLMLSTTLDPEVPEYPDSDKIAATDAEGKRLLRSRPGEPVEYWDGES